MALDLRAQTDDCAVTTAQCHLLLEIDRRGPSTGAELAESMGVDKSTLSRTLNALLQAGLVVRTPHPEDGRAWTAALSDPGRETVQRIDHACDDQYRHLLEHLDDSRHEALVEAAELLGAALHRDRRARRSRRVRRTSGLTPDLQPTTPTGGPTLPT